MKLEDLNDYGEQALQELEAHQDLEGLQAWYASHLAPSGQTTAWKRQIGKFPKEQRKEAGQSINQLAKRLTAAFEQKREHVKLAELAVQMQAEAVDVSLPSRPQKLGGYHPLTQALREVCDTFAQMGFYVFESPHVESDEYNFQLLNIPPDHPARDMQDTFYVSDDVVLRTHTSAGQIRAMQKFHPEPVRVVLPGLCYRNEAISARSEIQFHQVEGLMVGEHVRMSDLKGVLTQFARLIFGPDQAVRFRGSYFPFTEPSVEVDIKCTLCAGDGCRICKKTGWLELLGAGLVHPVVLRNGGYDPSKYRGIAFGMGIERLVMLRHGITDIRYFFQNDLRFLRQFR